MARGPSLYGSQQECWICHNTYNIHVHHIYGGVGRRPISDEEGCWLYLCGPHHNQSNFGVHFDKELDKSLKMDCQRRWERREGLEGKDAHDAFRKRFGVSYL